MFQVGSIGRSRKRDLEARKHENTLNCDDKTDGGGQNNDNRAKRERKQELQLVHRLYQQGPDISLGSQQVTLDLSMKDN